MKFISAIFLVCMFVLLVVGIYLGFQNRNSEALRSKVLPAIAIAVIGGLFTIWFSLKEEKIKISFPSTLIYHKKSGEALEKCDERYRLLYGGKLGLFSSIIKSPLRNGISFSNLDPDILFIETVTLLFTSRSQHPFGLIGHTVEFPEDPSFRDFPNQTLSWQDFSLKYKDKWRLEIKELFAKLEDPNIFGILGIREMCLPKGTTIKIVCDRINRNISLKNDFCEINIQICSNNGYKGLGEWKWILGYDDDKDNEFWTSNMMVYLSAKFSRFRSGHPDMPKYKRWVNLLFDRLRSCLDSEQQLNTAREKYHLYKNNINSWFESEKLRQKNLPKSNTIVTENNK